MPRQPYPSYNVHDYADVTTSYGDEAELRQLVKDCHARGIRVILDVLLHGVLDNESIDSAVQGVIDGPLYAKLNDEVSDTLAGDLSDDDNYWIAWSRHILDFSEYWRGGSPKRTPLQESHPEWFATDSAGSVSGVYTKAFDARSPSWQRYFRDSMMHLVNEYDIDGFRFDAPTYNFFANWAPWARARAFMSPLGCVPLFVDMRHDMRAAKPDSLLYTEPSGHLLRRSMDVNYNYDEQWLVSALMQGNHAGRAVRNGRDFMLWMQDRDDFLPVGSHTAHHIDSHDTFWWPQWGKKWRREQYSIDAVKALAATFLALDGPYMMFTGGEEGLEKELSQLLSFRNTHREFWAVRGEFDTAADSSGNLVIVRRKVDDREVVCIVNTSGTTAVKIPKNYSSGWQNAFTHGLQINELEPFGFVVANK
jgi:glycosidase